jgi:hypothetical protein
MSNFKTSSVSYEEYMKNELDFISKNFSVKTYKTAGDEKWEGFERGIDLRIQIQWKGQSIYEFLVEKPFWYQRNTNKEDRDYMRKWADPKIEMIKSGLVRKSTIVSRTKSQPKQKSKKSNNISYTQELFEKAKHGNVK